MRNLPDSASEATGEKASSSLPGSLLAIPYPLNKLENYPGRVEAPSLNSNNNAIPPYMSSALGEGYGGSQKADKRNKIS